jgi:hypothetical protein
MLMSWFMTICFKPFGKISHPDEKEEVVDDEPNSLVVVNDEILNEDDGLIENDELNLEEEINEAVDDKIVKKHSSTVNYQGLEKHKSRAVNSLLNNMSHLKVSSGLIRVRTKRVELENLEASSSDSIYVSYCIICAIKTKGG